jgi:hypothetical protein
MFVYFEASCTMSSQEPAAQAAQVQLHKRIVAAKRCEPNEGFERPGAPARPALECGEIVDIEPVVGERSTAS